MLAGPRLSRLAAAIGLALLGAPGAEAQAVTQSPHGPNLREACATCHKPESWKPARIAPTFKHAPQTFPLSGAHTGATCASCHRTLDFAKTPATCGSCHTDVHKGELGASCATCHTTRSFVDRANMSRAHQLTRFPLRGAHATVPCESCHRPSRPGQAQFVNQPTTCVACHATTFRATAAPPHAASRTFTQDCTSCHTITAWKGAKFDHNTTLFPLTGAHTPVPCASCHADKQYHGRSLACESCHQKDYLRAVNPPHTAGFPTNCASCHTTTGWAGARFDHQAMTKFPLTGAHVGATCAGCHADKVYRGKNPQCQSCHQSAWNATKAPNHAAAGFTADCATCHTTARWKGATYDHTRTRFPLTGAHRGPACSACHADNVFRGKSMECLSCHRAAYDGTQSPPHAAAGFTDCQSCHTTVQWKGAVFDHARTLFPLTGAHVAATCHDCHADKIYKGKATACVSCHQGDYAKTVNPPHASAGFPTACEACHTTTRWLGSPFDHAKTLFPLTGAHAAATCQHCHADKVYKGKPTTCVSCHQPDYAGTTNPSHANAGFSTTCQTCHGTVQWNGAVFDHARTQFPLTGAHVATTCNGCHADKVYAGKPTTCVSCHQADYNTALVPPHAASGFPVTCQNCHTTTKWRGAPFDHAKTLFPLTGAHVATSCADCHGNGVYKGKPTTCLSCHQGDYAKTVNPPHVIAGLPTVCQSCHTTAAWTGGTYDHSVTAFALTGAHRAATCNDCHADKVYRGKPTTCASCHQSEYAATTKPNHAASGFPVTCEACHNTTQWLGGSFNHATTKFPLTGAHLAATCLDCHGDGVYQGKPTTCSSCHGADYSATTNPHHAAAGFLTTCQNCHNTTAWVPTPYDHSATAFPLTGAHVGRACKDCHADAVYKGKPTACVACHLTDYNGTTNPNHLAAQFPTTCQSCHTTTTWLGATFDHDASFFPIYTGKHKGKWQSCATCHTSPSNYKVFSCLTCHKHNKIDTDKKHIGKVAGYAYDSIKCYACHPRGN
jgi:hypothetical protein